MKKIKNAAEMEKEKYRLKLKQEKLLKEIRLIWKEIKEQGDPANLAIEGIIHVAAGKSPAGRLASTAAEIIMRYLRKK